MSRARREKESHDGNSLGVVLFPTEIRSEPESKIQSFPILGGLHHRYEVAAVAALFGFMEATSYTGASCWLGKSGGPSHYHSCSVSRTLAASAEIGSHAFGSNE